MAFTTTTGAGGTSLIGTSGVDSTSLASNVFPLYIGAQAANDVVLLTGTSSSVRAELGKGADNFTTGALSSSTISGNLGNDVITTTGAISGSAGLINGNQGADNITVGGNVTSGARILGGADNDTITVSAGATISSGGIINGNKGDDTITLTTSATTSSSTIYGGEGNDTMTGGTGAAIFSGDKGNDTITGSDGADKLYGGEGNDLVLASSAIDASTDTLYGGDGVDTFGFLGNTTLGGAVAFTTAGTIDDSATFTGADVIYDFTAGSGGDVIDLNGTGAFSWGGAKSTTAGSSTVVTDTYYAVSGTWSSGVFTPSETGRGIDTMIVATAAGATGWNVATDAVVLKGVVNTQIQTGNLA